MLECTSAVLQGSVLGLVGFAVFRNGPGKRVSSDGTEFADEAEVCSAEKMSTHCRVQERSHNELLDAKITN